MAGILEQFSKGLFGLAPTPAPNGVFGQVLDSAAQWGRGVQDKAANIQTTLADLLRNPSNALPNIPPQTLANLLQQPVTPEQKQAMVDRGIDNALNFMPGVLGTIKTMPKLDYQIAHKPMTVEGGASQLHDLTPSFGEDIYGKNALQYFGSGDAREKEVLNLLKQLRGNPSKEVTIYRGVPAEAGAINAGDWVTLSRQAAEDYASQHKGGKVISMKVPASHVTGWADSLLEFGYHPPK